MSDTSSPNNSTKLPARTPRWFKVVFVIALVFWLVGLTVPYLLNVDRHRASIASLISKQTGRQVTLGMIRARILPQVGFDVAGFHMSNPQGFVAGSEFASAEHVRGTLAFWPLILHRRLRLTSLELTHPRLTLLQNSRGENNYTFPDTNSARAALSTTAPPIAMRANYVEAGFAAALPPQDNAAPSANPEAGPDAAPAVSSVLQVDELVLRSATVIYGSVDAIGNTTYVVESDGFDVTLRHMQLQPLVVPTWRAEGSLGGARLSLANWNGPITFHSGSVTLRNAALESNFSVDFGKAARVDGTLSVPDVEHAVVKFDLKSADVNVDRLEASSRTPKRATQQTPPPASASAAARHATIIPAANASGGTATLVAETSATSPASSKLLAQGHMDAKKVRWDGYVAGPATADMRFYGDRIEIWPVTVRFVGGSLQASARTDSKQTPQRFAVNLEARNLNVEQVLETTPSLRGRFAGTGELDLQVFGSLISAWEHSLTGTGQFAVRNGRISGFSLSGAAQSIANLAGVNGSTVFAAITGDLDIGRERIASRDIHLDSSLGTLDLKGSCGLDSGPGNALNNSLNYDGQINVQFSGQSDSAAQGSDKGGGNSIVDQIGRVLAKNQIKVTVPFALHGTLQHPEILPSHGVVNFPAPAASHSTDKGLSYPNLFQRQAPQ